MTTKTLREAAQALREGRSPAEVADMLDRAAEDADALATDDAIGGRVDALDNSMATVGLVFSEMEREADAIANDPGLHPSIKTAFARFARALQMRHG